jgi:hypothetical protein
MLRKIKKQKAFLYLSRVRSDLFPAGVLRSLQRLDPGEEGGQLSERVRTLAREGLCSCFIFTDASLERKIHHQLPLWIAQLKMEQPQIDFHIRSGRPV